MWKKSEIFEKNLRKSGFVVPKSKGFATYNRKTACSDACGGPINDLENQNLFSRKKSTCSQIAEKNTGGRLLPKPGTIVWMKRCIFQRPLHVLEGQPVLVRASYGRVHRLPTSFHHICAKITVGTTRMSILI